MKWKHSDSANLRQGHHVVIHIVINCSLASYSLFRCDLTTLTFDIYVAPPRVSDLQPVRFSVEAGLHNDSGTVVTRPRASVTKQYNLVAAKRQ